jgi:hypothetical protein
MEDEQHADGVRKLAYLCESTLPAYRMKEIPELQGMKLRRQLSSQVAGRPSTLTS